MSKFKNVKSRGAACSSRRSMHIIQLLCIYVLLIEATIAASTSEKDNNKFGFAQEPKFPRDGFVNSTCGGSTGNNTFFLSPTFPNEDSSGGTCDLIVNKFNESICQIRIDFVSFSLAQPNSEGFCNTDFMTVTGGSHSVPILCGYNVGQHMYVDVSQEGCSLKIIVDMDSTVAFPRLFNLQITQIPCASVNSAPSGCLQYYTSTSGNVQSFNFPITPTEAGDAITSGVTRQLSNIDYTVCIRPEDGYNSISWTPDPNFAPYNFFVNGYASSFDDDVYGSQYSVTTGDTRCVDDYVIVPNAQWTNVSGEVITSDRFCGPAFPDPATSVDIPFELYVHSDGSEAPIDSGNIGFSLHFRQNIL